MIPSLTWNLNINVIPASQGTALAQFQATMFNMKQALCGTGGATFENGNAVIGAGDAGIWTVTRSSNGTVTAGAGDNWTTSANIIADIGGNNHSWAVFRSPASPTFLPLAGQFVEMLVDCNFAAGGIGTEQVTFQVANSTNTFTGGSLTAAPTLPTNGVNLGTKRVCPGNSTALINRRLHMWRSTTGHFHFVGSRDGGGLANAGMSWECAALLNGDIAGTDSVQRFPVVFTVIDDTSSGLGLYINNTGASANAAGWWTDGTAERANGTYPMNPSTLAQATSGYTSAGNNVNSRYPSIPCDYYSQTSGHGRYVGRKPDIEYSFSNAANLSLEGGVDTFRRLTFGELSIFTNGPIPVL